MTRIVAAGVVATVVAALLLATSGHLVDPVAYGLQVAVILAGSVSAALVWRRRRPGNRLAAWLLAYAVATALVSLQGVRDPLLHSVGVAADPMFFAVGYLLVFAFPEGRVSGRPERLLLGGISLY